MTPAPLLLLFPTAPERDACRTAFVGRAGLAVELCGFGPIVSAARTASLLEQVRPARVVLAGIAGALEPGLPLAGAHWFGRVALDGLGAGEGAGLSAPHAMGLPQWPGAPGGAFGPTIEDRLPLWCPPGAPRLPELLCVTAAAGDSAQTAHRRVRFPAAAAEEMEAFGAAAACALYGVEFGCLRGLSNLAGVRAKKEWRIADALEAVRAELSSWLEATP